MNAGTFEISVKVIMDALSFPSDWKMESMVFFKDTRTILVLVSGADFPPIPLNGQPRKCTVTIHKENLWFEVNPINND